MRRYLTRERIGWIIVLVLFVTLLTGCSGKMYEVPIRGFGNETNPFGWILVWPIGWLMHAIGSVFDNSFAWGLIFTTIIVRTIAWPIYAKTNDMTMKMNLANPDIQRLQQKYAGRTDQESKARQSQEMMAIYKKHNINLLGCFYPFLQMPIFMAMYAVVRRIRVVPAEGVTNVLNLTNNKMFIFDLGANATSFSTDMASSLFGIFLSAVVGLSMLLIQKISQKKPSYAKNIPTNNNAQANSMAKQMKIMNYVMIIMMVGVAATDNGMALYWVIGNLYSLCQNIINRKLSEIKYEKMKKNTY